MVIMFKYCRGDVTKIARLYWVVKEYEKQVRNFRYFCLKHLKFTTVNFPAPLLEYLKRRRIIFYLSFYAV